MEKHFRKHFPKPMDATVRSVVHSDIATWLASTGHEGRTYDRWRLFARQLFDVAEADGIVSRSPFDAKRIPRAKKEPVQRHAPTVEEFAKIVNEMRVPTLPRQTGKRGGQRPLKQDESADFAAFLGLAGVGQAEASGLDWSHIEKDRIRFTRQKTKKHFYVPIYPWLRPLLDELRRKAGPKPSGRVFKVNSVKHSLASACERLGLPHFTQRSLRQSLIGRLWKSGVDRKIIAKWQGHSDGGKLITDTYTEVFGSDDEAYEQMQLAKAAGKVAEGASA
jgi:integrase